MGLAIGWRIHTGVADTLAAFGLALLLGYAFPWAAACRHLFGNPDPAASIQVWPMQHPVEAVLLWSAVLLAVFAPLAVHLYRRKSLT